ncbi:MAG: hypothetical protein D6689_11430 [Deltaproteobacteria bacterium]|nr:MAG: hypothetical protein D6689_11430 [Deltaproteobacteria bacterium]
MRASVRWTATSGRGRSDSDARRASSTRVVDGVAAREIGGRTRSAGDVAGDGPRAAALVRRDRTGRRPRAFPGRRAAPDRPAFAARAPAAALESRARRGIWTGRQRRRRAAAVHRAGATPRAARWAGTRAPSSRGSGASIRRSAYLAAAHRSGGRADLAAAPPSPRAPREPPAARGRDE